MPAACTCRQTCNEPAQLELSVRVTACVAGNSWPPSSRFVRSRHRTLVPQQPSDLHKSPRQRRVAIGVRLYQNPATRQACILLQEVQVRLITGCREGCRLSQPDAWRSLSFTAGWRLAEALEDASILSANDAGRGASCSSGNVGRLRLCHSPQRVLRRQHDLRPSGCQPSLWLRHVRERLRLLLRE